MSLALVHLDGDVRQPRPNVLTSNVCPVCGGKAKRYKRVFHVTETPRGLIAYCHVCHADHEAISQALGVRIGPSKVEVIDNADPGPFYPDEEVLRAIRPGEIEVCGDFVEGPGDEIGELANAVVWHTVYARAKVKRLGYPADVGPYSQRFIIRVTRKLGRRVGSDKAMLVARRIAARGTPSFHYFNKATAERKGYRGLRVFSVRTLRAYYADTRSIDNPDLSCSAEEPVKLPGSLERFLGAANLAHGPPGVTLAAFLADA